MGKWMAAAACVVAVVLVLGACGDQREERGIISEPDRGNDDPTPGEPAPEPGLTGQVILASDVQTQPNLPWADATVVAVPADRADIVWNTVDEIYTDRPPDLSRVTVRLPTDADGSVATDTDAKGRFSLESVPDGSYLLCVGQAQDDDIITSGCAEFDAPASDLWISFGEAGLVIDTG